MTKALIWGVGGMDGSYLSEHLLSLGYDVHGVIRRNSVSEHQESRLDHLAGKITTHYGDVNDTGNIYQLLSEIKPDEIYNLAAQSHVRISFETAQSTVQGNAIGVLNILEAMRQVCPKAKFYQASSSEMFGNSVGPDGVQRITTPMLPVSPYGCAKLFGYHITKVYRESYGLHACNGVLFNHESIRRGSNFVTQKIIKGAAAIKRGTQRTLELGNLDSKRDWGHSKDYVRAMHMILNHTVPYDWVVATGETHSIRELCDLVFSKLGLNYENHVVSVEKYKRPNELDYLCGDSTPIRTVLGWQPEYTFEELIEEMIAQYYTETIYR